MNKEQQDLAWACLSKGARENISYSYQNSPCGSWIESLFEEIYGERNLTSDAEPEEMLMVERKKVQEYYSESENDSLVTDITEYDREYALGVCDTLGYLFGDKCLPDKEQSKPKFKVGDKVRVNNTRYNKYFGSFGVVKSIEEFVRGTYVYDLENDTSFIETSLEPYTEPSNVSTNDTKDDTKESVNLSQNIANCDKSKDNQLKDNMEEKELNLCELLKGHEGETFYSTAYGEVIYKGIEILSGEPTIALIEQAEPKVTISRSIFSNGKLSHNGEYIFFPSKDQRNWEEWNKENNHKTPKTWSEFVKDNVGKLGALCDYGKADCSFTENNTPIEKSALALLKIHQLIKVGYGGNVSYERYSELQYDNVYKIAPIGCKKHVLFHVVEVEGESDMNHIMFHTKEQAKEFLSHPENVQLLCDYFLI